MTTKAIIKLLEREEISNPTYYENCVEVTKRHDSIGATSFEMRILYALDGSYIGIKDTKFCQEFILDKCIFPERVHENLSVASIGWSESEQKYYGWSHRAVCGFGIESKVEKGDCAYRPSNEADFLEDVKRFYADEWEDPPSKINVFAEHTSEIMESSGFVGDSDCLDDGTYASIAEIPNKPDEPDNAGELIFGVKVTWTNSDTMPNKKMHGKPGSAFSPYPDTWGRGEWVAKTLEDAKQMAIDFSDDVS